MSKEYLKWIPINHKFDQKRFNQLKSTLTKLAINGNNIMPFNIPNELIHIICIYAIGTIRQCLACRKEILILNDELYVKHTFKMVVSKMQPYALCSDANCQKLIRNKEIIDHCDICFNALPIKGNKLILCKMCGNVQIRACHTCLTQYAAYDIVCSSHTSVLQSALKNSMTVIAPGSKPKEPTNQDKSAQQNTCLQYYSNNPDAANLEPWEEYRIYGYLESRTCQDQGYISGASERSWEELERETQRESIRRNRRR